MERVLDSLARAYAPCRGWYFSSPVVVVPLSFFAYLWALFSKDERGLHDLLAGTQVVRAHPAMIRLPALGPGQDTTAPQGGPS